MNNEDNSLDLLDLDDNNAVDTLPEVPAFVAPKPKKPWLLLTLGMVIIVLSSYIIIRSIGGDSSSSIEVDLDAPVAVVEDAAPVEMNVMPPVKPAPVPEKAKPAPVVTAPAPVAEPVPEKKSEPQVQSRPQPVTSPVRVVQDRKEVKFEPAKAKQNTVAKPKKVTAKPQNVAPVSNWYVQFGSYSTRALAEAAQAKMQKSHAGLFNGKQFVILAAQLKNGTSTYRLRVGFNSSADANGFCRNAKADGLDCYITK